MMARLGKTIPAMLPIDTPEIIMGSMIDDIPISIWRPLPFFNGWGILAKSKYLITLAKHMLIFEIEIAFFESKLKKP